MLQMAKYEAGEAELMFEIAIPFRYFGAGSVKSGTPSGFSGFALPCPGSGG